jgi:hypothetical protein
MRNWPDCTPEQEQALNKLVNSRKIGFIYEDVEYRYYTDGRIGYYRVDPLFMEKSK